MYCACCRRVLRHIFPPLLFPLLLPPQVLYLAPESTAALNYGECMEQASLDYWSFGVLMYEMLVGCLPFHGKTLQDMLFAMEQEHGPITIPSDLEWNARTLLLGLLQYDPTQRAGHHGGIEEIMTHPFFTETNLIE